MPKRKSQTTQQLQLLIESNRQLTAAVHTYAQTTQHLVAAVAQLAEALADDLVEDVPLPATYLNGKSIE